MTKGRYPVPALFFCDTRKGEGALRRSACSRKAGARHGLTTANGTFVPSLGLLRRTVLANRPPLWRSSRPLPQRMHASRILALYDSCISLILQAAAVAACLFPAVSNPNHRKEIGLKNRISRGNEENIAIFSA